MRALHNHTALLSLLPTLSSVTPIAVPASLLRSAPASPEPACSAHVPIEEGASCFELIEKLPLALYFTMVASFNEIDDGTGCVLHAPGIRVDSWTRVVRQGEGWEIREDVEMRGNWFFLGLLKRNVLKARRELHEALIGKIKHGKEENAVK